MRGGGGIILAHGCRGTRRAEKSSKCGVACIKRNKPPTAGWWTMGEMASVPNPMSCPLSVGQGYSTQENAPRLVVGEQASPRPRLVLGAADRSSLPRDNQLEPHSSSAGTRHQIVSVGIHPALLQLLIKSSASRNTHKGTLVPHVEQESACLASSLTPSQYQQRVSASRGGSGTAS